MVSLGFFFARCWNIVGNDVISAVIHFFSSGRLLQAAKAYFLTLIPKKHSPETFADFRPISLLNLTYKVLSKILAIRLSDIIPFLISKHQEAFVRGRSIYHHVALDHDLFIKLNSKVSTGSVCLKLDITKAFDKLQWDFIFRALQFFNFSSKWINLIKELVCTWKYSILINRSQYGFFSSTCGLQEGDPISPYMFISAEEILSLNVDILILEGVIVPISLVHKTPCHLLYADDILFFLKAIKSNLRCLQCFLNLY